MKKITYRIIPVLALLLATTTTSFSPKEENKLVVYKPAKDFSFITTYHCIYDLFGEEQWTKNSGRSFDINGVHLTNNNYHPVNACHYALYCYDEYQKTGEERLKKAFLAQVGYLRDSTKYHEVDGYKVGYPYLNSWHDLKAPWYSALAQSEAISVLVRYYAMTNDKTILPLIVKLKNFMIAPQTDGKGTLNYTPEGNIWFEEYPNSPQERQVLNGFFLALVALYDYSNLFPDDEEAKDLYNKSVKSAKESIKFYDTGTWLKYNRGDQRLVANGYMKWQVLEMKLLYKVIKDPFFLNQYMLWSTYAYDKPYEAPGCKLPYYNFSIPLTDNGKGELLPTFTSNPLSLASIVSNATVPSVSPNDLNKLYDNNNNTSVILRFNDSISEIPKMQFDFIKPQNINSVKLSFASADTVTGRNVQIFYQEPERKNFKKVNFSNAGYQNRTLSLTFPEISAQSVTIQFSDVNANIMVSGLQMSAPSAGYLPEYFHYLTPVYSKEGRSKFAFDKHDMDEIIIFYKSSTSKEDLKKIVWSQEKMVTKQLPDFNDSPDKFFQFLIIGKPSTLKARLSNVKFES